MDALLTLLVVYHVWVAGSYLLDHPGPKPRRRTSGSPPRSFGGNRSTLSLGYGNPAWHARMDAHRVRVETIRQHWAILSAEYERELAEWQNRKARRRRGWRILLPL